MSVRSRNQPHISIAASRISRQPIRSLSSAGSKKVSVGYYIARGFLHGSGYALFALMLIVPTQLQTVKLALMVFLLGSIIVYSTIRRSWHIHPIIVRWTVVMVVVGFSFSLLGWFMNAPGVLRTATVYIYWPIVFTVFVAGIGRDRIFLEGILRTMVFATLFSALILLGLIKIDSDSWIVGELIKTADPNFDFFRFQRYQINTLVFLMPFVMTSVLLWTKSWGRIARRPWFWCATFLALAASAMTDRRALWAVVAIAPAVSIQIAFGLTRRTQGKFISVLGRIVILALGGFIVAFLLSRSLTGFNFDALVQRLSNLFALDASDSSDMIRSQQFYSLLAGWYGHPLFGSGFGAIVPGPLRSQAMPWASELSYLLLLYNTGIVGFLFYSAGVGWIFWTGIRVVRSQRDPASYMIPILTGMVSFLVANASNPYLAKYDYMWTLFLPIFFINYWLLTFRNSVNTYG